ncbi:MAG TPA: peptidylprolyl isomerase, partial [Gemmataceae bacterium]|nr:peptidylprolyl isomerase [Gemmataceae bacterium]
EAVALYEKAATFLWEKIDQKKGRIKGRWDGRELTLPELIEREKKERSDLAKLFKWPGEAEDRGRAVRVLIETEKGDIDVELDAARAPVTVANFLRYVDGHYYDGGRFHRTVKPDNQPDDKVKIEVIQAGINPDAGKKEFPPIKLERTRDTKLAHKDGTISMARNGPDTATSDFFICIGDQPELDFGGKRNPDGQGFAAFGRVVKGMDVVKKIQAARADGQELKPPVKIIKVTRRR